MSEWRTARSFLGDQWRLSEPTTWETAYGNMVGIFERWLDDDCPECADHAAEQLPALRALTPGTEWFGEVEGDDYVIMRVTTTVEEIEKRIEDQP